MFSFFNLYVPKLFPFSITYLFRTTNFVHGFPFVCVSIGLVVGKEPILGVVYDPSADELFVAIKGRGAYLNQRRISVSTVKTIKEAMIVSLYIHMYIYIQATVLLQYIHVLIFMFFFLYVAN